MKKHPLLRYLFILSLISIIIQLSSTGFNLLKNPKESLLEKAEQLKDIKPSIAQQLEELAYEYDTNKYFQIMPYMNLLFILISLLSVILMWQLKQQGWYLYLFAEFFPYLFSVVFWENYTKYYAGWGNGMVVSMTLAMVAFDILFAGLYFYALRETKKMYPVSEESGDSQ
ncbi:MAG: hypothetical protein N2203_04320 [Bacteroidia bacterium]|nr:hypothetical protein [Bacteroidia bacterium]